MIEPTQADIDLADEIAAAFGHGERERPWLAELIARARIEGAERMREAIIADFLTWYPGGSIDKPGYAAAKAHVQSMRALSPADVVKERNDG